MTALYAIPIGFVKHKFAFFSEKICLNLAKSDMRMLYWKQMQEKQHPKGGMRVAQADDERQFLAACYQRHRISMIRLAKCYAADSAAVEDIVSDSLVALMEKIDLLRTLTEEQERAYVLAVVRNTAMDELRRKQRQRGRFLRDGDEALALYPDPAALEEKVLMRETMAAVRRAIAELPEKEQQVLRLKVLEKPNGRGNRRRNGLVAGQHPAVSPPRAGQTARETVLRGGSSMNEKNQQVSDEQIDALIRSGLWQDEQPLTADEEKLADAAFARAMAKIDRKAKQQKRRTVLHMLDRVVRVAACLIVAVGIAFPIALANSEAFREQILQLVLSINPETGMAHVGMEPAKDEQTANVPRMDVPDGWEGLFFPTFLPDSLPLVRCETTRGDQVHSEAYYADETRSLRFEEQDNLDGWNVRAADARVLTIYLHSVPGYLIDRQTEDTHEVSIIWAEGKRMLRVTSIGLPADEAVLVAQSVKKIFAE